jgi:glycosyltransferase domain-containing protein
MNESFLDKLTIVIPTYERQEYIIRCMKYWSGKKVKVIVVDGSKISLEVSVVGTFSKNIKYIHNPIGLYGRMLSSIELIETEYVMQGCDDEFYIPSALNSCLKKLSSNSNFVSCIGRALAFNYNNKLVFSYDIYRRLKNLKLDDPNPTTRIKKHFSNYVPAHLYAVCKASIWKVIAKYVFSKEYNFYGAWEMQIELLVPFANKTLSIPELMWLRSMEVQAIRGTSPSMTPSLRMFDWWLDKKYENEKKDFIKRTKIACKELNKVTKQGHIIDVESSYECYLSQPKKKKPFTYLLYYNFFRYCPNLIKNNIKRILKVFGYGPAQRGYGVVNKIFSLIDKAKLLAIDGIKVDFVELEQIEKIIALFHENKKRISK